MIAPMTQQAEVDFEMKQQVQLGSRHHVTCQNHAALASEEHL